MAFNKKSTISLVILVGVVLGAVGYLFGTLAVSAASGGKAATAVSTGPVTAYETPIPVADFTLADQTGKPYAFASARGKVVLMAFLYTHCGDTCPFAAQKMGLALDALGDHGKNVELVVVSTDPERDTVAVLADYSKALGLYDRWHFVTGPLADLQKLYKDLKITVVKADEAEVEDTAKNASDLGISLPAKDKADDPVTGLTDEQVAAGGAVAKKFSGGYEIAHSAPFWVVDTEGKLRASLDVSASPTQIAEVLKGYLKKS